MRNLERHEDCTNTNASNSLTRGPLTLPSWEGIKGRGKVAEIINKVSNILTPTLTLPHRRGRGICLGPELL
jgi:hypothetical protein